MATIEKLKDIQGKVRRVLLKYPETRDDDKKLVTIFWYFQLKKIGKNAEDITAMDFFDAYRADALCSADLLTRARRKVQEDTPSLRGEAWEERHKDAEQTRKNI